MRAIRLIFACFAVFAAAGVLAHSDEHLDKTASPHGGQLRMAGMYHLELVPAANKLTLYVTDHADKQVKTAGANASATVLSNKTKTKVTLVPAGENALSGTGNFALAADMKVVVSLSMPGQTAVQARFTPLQARGH